MLAVSIFVQACHGQTSPSAHTATSKEVAPGVQLVGRIANARITESSGLVQSTKDPAVFWTHNDGKRPHLFAMSRDGKSLNEFLVVNVTLRDWEDLATDGKGRLYIADTGNNDTKREQVAVYEVEEPDPKSRAGMVRVTRSWQLRFPKEPFDCESLFIRDGYGYVVSKVFKDAKAEIYRFPLQDQTAPVVLELVAKLKIQSPATGACLSPDGKKLAIVCKSGAFVYNLGENLSELGKQKPHQTKFRHEHIEACAFVPEGLLATAESREIYLFTDEMFRPAK